MLRSADIAIGLVPLPVPSSTTESSAVEAPIVDGATAAPNVDPAGSHNVNDRLAIALVCAFIAVVLLWRIADFGIWDPWELSTADAARHLAHGEPTGEGPISFVTWMVSLGFRLFGVHEWAGRLPIAIAGVLTVLCAYFTGKRFADARTGLYAALITGTSPLFVFNARTMLGAAPDFAVQSALALVAFATILPARTHSRYPEATQRALLLGCTLIATLLAITTRGALLGALPPLLAASVVAVFSREAAPAPKQTLAIALMSAISGVLLLLVVRDSIADSTDYSYWLGGRSGSSTPPTFDAVLELVFHSFAPWSALLPIAIGRLWTSGRHIGNVEADADVEISELALRNACMVWAALGYGTQTLFLSRYGHDVTYLPIVALALLVALLLRDIERRGDALWGGGLAAALLAGLILRDYALYPNGAVRGMPLEVFEVPKAWNPARIWSSLLGPFALCAALSLSVDSERSQKLELRAPYLLVRDQWRRSLAFKVWLVAFALVLLGLTGLGLVAYALPKLLHMPTITLKWSRRMVYAPFVLAAVIASMQLLHYGFGRLGRYRFVPLLVLGCSTGVYAAQGFLPRLSEHFSPREVYASYNALARSDEPLGEFHVSGRAAAYYAKGQVIELDSIKKLIDHLVIPGQRWAAFPSDELAEIDNEYRKRTHRHLVLVDVRSSRVVLAATQTIAGKADENYLREAIRSTPPDGVQHPVSVDFDDRVELLGYDLELPQKTHVGAGETFTISWYFRVRQHVPSGYKIFVHIDGQGQRVHGDHDPLDGKYPVQLWNPGDVIVDTQRIDVPASYRAGEYTIYMGFYSGDSRLPIKQGPTDGEDNRARVGVLRIQ